MKENDHLTDENVTTYLKMTERQVNDYLAKMKASKADNTERTRWHRPLKYEQFEAMMKASAEMVMRQRGTYTDYVLDEVNRDIMTQLYYYFIGNQDKCRWNVDKGIFLYGRIGCGKTLLITSYLKVVNMMLGIIATTIHAKEIYPTIQNNGFKMLIQCPLFIDELGRESLEINEFGNKIRPIQDLFAMRYESGARTFCTSNFSSAALEGKNEGGVQKGYGKYVRTRMEEMMNIVEMPGENRRPKY